MIYVILYLLAIVAANVSVSIFGPTVAVINSFLFIGFNLTCRDKLHDAWRGDKLTLKMLSLILFGSILSAVFGAGWIAIASFTAFMVSESVDFIVYSHLIKTKSKQTAVNISNIFGALIDSLLFPILAFGFPVLWGVVIGQFVAKTVGGYVWMVAINKVVANE